MYGLSALQRLALALLLPEGGLARIAVFRAGRVPLEKAVPGDGDLVGAVWVLFQHVTRDVAGPVLDVQRLFRPGNAGKTDQEEDHAQLHSQPPRNHASLQKAPANTSRLPIPAVAMRLHALVGL